MLTLHIVAGFLLIAIAIARFVAVGRYRKPITTLRTTILGLSAFQGVSGVALILTNTSVLTRVCASALITIAILLALEYALRRTVHTRAKQTQMLH